MSAAKLPASNVKKEWHLARQLVLYGNGDGKPIANPEKLAELTGLTTETIRRYIEGWLKEREEMLAQSSSSTLSLQLSAKELHLHKIDMEFLRSQLNQVEWEVNNLDKMLARLENLVEKFADSEMLPEALSIFSSYVTASGNKQKLRQQFLQLQKQWTSLVGVDSLQEVALTRAKADATLAAKMQARKDEAEQGVRDVTPAGSSVFKRTV